MTNSSAGVSVIVPVFNEEAAICFTLADIHEHLGGTGRDYEIIVVDDGSTDSSSHLLSQRSDCRVVQHPQNRGYGASLKSGIREARYPLVAILDADGTYPIDRLPELVERTEQADMVVGYRNSGWWSSLWLRCVAKWMLTRFAELLVGKSIPDMNSGMRVFRRHLAERYLPLFPDGFSFTTTITLAMLTDGRRVEFEPIRYMRRVGRSKIRPFADTLNVLRAILRTTFHFAPGRIIVPVATACSLLLGVSLAWNSIVVPDVTDKIILMLANMIQLALIFFLAELVGQRAPQS